MNNETTSKRNLDAMKKHWPLASAIGILWGTIGILLILSVKNNQGHLVYALDDPYIHMAIAKNYVQYGVWGVDKYNFSSSSSSLLWTLLLSFVYFLFGENITSPLIINVIFGTLIVSSIYMLLRKYKLNPSLTLVVLLLVIFLTPLPPVIFCGLEHTMHALITILFVYLSGQILSKEKPILLEYSLLLLLAPIVIMSRYEGLFLVFVVCVFLL